MIPQKKKNKNEKLSIQEYIKLKEKRTKRRFHFELYPWPVLLAITLPIIMMLALIIGYVVYMRTVPG